MKLKLAALMIISTTALTPVYAADYVIDTEKAHAFIDFSVQHLGFSWVRGRFDDFSGHFSYDADHPEASQVEVHIDVGSVDTNFAERDKHLRERFLQSEQYPEATFKSTSFKRLEDGTLIMVGDLTLHGITNSLSIPIEKVGEGDDPWGGHRAGFVGKTQFRMADYGIDVSMLGPSGENVYLTLSIEGVRQ